MDRMKDEMTERKWTAMETSHLRHMDCTTNYETMLCERAADRIEEQQKRIRELERWVENWNAISSANLALKSQVRELEQSAAKKDNAIISYQKRIRELEIKIERVQSAANELAEALADD